MRNHTTYASTFLTYFYLSRPRTQENVLRCLSPVLLPRHLRRADIWHPRLSFLGSQFRDRDVLLRITQKISIYVRKQFAEE